MQTKYLVLVALVGFVLMLAGFIGYVFDPATAYQAVFVVGVVLLAASYFWLYLDNRKAVIAARAADEEEARDGFFYIMDEDYSAPVGDATILDLTGRD